MKNQLLLLSFLIVVSQLSVYAQGKTYFTAPNSETIQKNAIMPAETGIYIAMQKSTTSSSLYWLKNNALTEVKSIGNQLASIYDSNGTYGKQWFTNGDNALFVTQNGFPAPRTSAVWVTNGTATGTDTLFTYAYGTNVNIAGMIGTDLYFSTTSLTPYQTVLYKTNFTKAGTSIVKTITKTNLTWNYVDNQKLYMNGYTKRGVYDYAALYAFDTDTTLLILGQNFFPARVINGDLYAYADGRDITRKNLATKVVTKFYFPDTKEGDRVYHVDEIIGVFKNKLYLKCNLSLSSNNIANHRIYTGDISETTTIINLTELRSTSDKSIIMPSGFRFGDNLAYFYAIDGYGGNASIFTTDSQNKNTHVVQELMTGTNWVWAYEKRSWMCGDRFYFYGADYKIGSTVTVGRALSSCDSTAGSLTLLDINAGANAIIQDMVNFQGKLIYSIDNFTSNKLYVIDACNEYTESETVIETSINELPTNLFGTAIYPNPSKGLFTVEMAANPNNSSIEIYTLLGKKVYSQVINSSKTVLDLKLQSGIYFVKIGDPKGQMQAKRMIIQ